MSEAATVQAAPVAEVAADPGPVTPTAEMFTAELFALDGLLRERGTSVTDLLCVVAKNAFGIADIR